MQVLYINLESRKDRNEEFLRRNSASVDCCRINAREGELLRIDDLLAAGLIAEPLEAYSLRVLGNALSHKELWQRAVSAGTPADPGIPSVATPEPAFTSSASAWPW